MINCEYEIPHSERSEESPYFKKNATKVTKTKLHKEYSFDFLDLVRLRVLVP